MADTVLVRPRRGLILAGVPRSGAELPRSLAEEWIADQLVERIATQAQPVTRPKQPTPRAQARRRHT